MDQIYFHLLAGFSIVWEYQNLVFYLLLFIDGHSCGFYVFLFIAILDDKVPTLKF